MKHLAAMLGLVIGMSASSRHSEDRVRERALRPGRPSPVPPGRSWEPRLEEEQHAEGRQHRPGVRPARSAAGAARGEARPARGGLTMSADTRRFSVALGIGERHLKITAADEPTRAWADRHGPVLGVALWKLEQAIGGTKLAPEPKPWERIPHSGVETPRTIAAKLAQFLRLGFPEESFDVQAAASC